MSDDPDDPYENYNRNVHAFNKAADRAVVKPVSQAYGTVVPAPARQGVSNVAENLGQPLNFINHALQGDVEDASATFFRFAMNTVFGFGGLLDPATDAGLVQRDTDFGETLAVLGAERGPYVELLFLGPSTERDSVGLFVDFFMNPVSYALGTPETYVATGVQVLDLVNDRYEFAPLIDALLYESADSYSAARIAFLQSQAGGELTEDDLEDPYALE